MATTHTHTRVWVVWIWSSLASQPQHKIIFLFPLSPSLSLPSPLSLSLSSPPSLFPPPLPSSLSLPLSLSLSHPHAYTKFASKLDKQALDSMRESVSAWTASMGKEKEERTEKKEALIGPRPTSSAALIGPMRGPTIGPVQVATPDYFCSSQLIKRLLLIFLYACRDPVILRIPWRRRRGGRWREWDRRGRERRWESTKKWYSIFFLLSSSTHHGSERSRTCTSLQLWLLAFRCWMSCYQRRQAGRLG